MAYDFSAAASSLLGGLARRKRSAQPGMPAQDEEQPIPGFMGAALDLGVQQRSKSPMEKQVAEPVSNSPSYQQRAGAAGASGGSMSDAERFDTDRINSLDNTLSAAQRTQGFMRYRAKYGQVAAFGNR